MSKVCLVTGGSGFIGSAIVMSLVQRGDCVRILDLAMPPPEAPLRQGADFVHADVRDWPRVLEAMRGVDEVYHCSGVLGTAELIDNTITAIDVNVQGVVNVLEAARLAEVGKVFLPTKPNDWRNTYTITKVACEHFGLMYHEVHGMDVTIMRWFNAYGPRQHIWPIRKAVPTFILAALCGRPITIYGSGRQTVDMIHVQDIARIAIDGTRQGWACGKVADVGCGEPIAVNELAEMVLASARSWSPVADKSSLLHLPMRSGEPEDSDIRAQPSLVCEHGIQLTDLRCGLDDTVGWYATHMRQRDMDYALDYYEVPAA